MIQPYDFKRIYQKLEVMRRNWNKPFFVTELERMRVVFTFLCSSNPPQSSGVSPLHRFSPTLILKMTEWKIEPEFWDLKEQGLSYLFARFQNKEPFAPCSIEHLLKELEGPFDLLVP